MQQFDLRQHDTSLDDLGAIFRRRLAPAADAAEATVREILEQVRCRGDAAVLEYTRRWDSPDGDSPESQALEVPATRIDAAVERIRKTPLWPVLETAAARIRRFHEQQRRATWLDTSVPGEALGQIIRPLARVGVYVPGGTAAYPSTVLMTVIPARVAGVPEVFVASPPGKTGAVPDATLAACSLAGATRVYAMGGAQAIAALAYGTETVLPVDKIVGPGNVYVNLAKRLVYGTVGIDMLAGPSEVAVLGDDLANPEAAAADVIAQCEHDVHCSALIATASDLFADSVLREIERQIAQLPERGEIVRTALRRNGFLVRTHDTNEAAAVVSRYAPEHLHVDVREPWGLLSRIENAGAILIGSQVSASVGDYLAGPSHTLPTAGCARFSSPLNVDDFLKKSSVLYLNPEAAKSLNEMAAVFAEAEGLPGHVRAAQRDHESTPTTSKED